MPDEASTRLGAAIPLLRSWRLPFTLAARTCHNGRALSGGRVGVIAGNRLVRHHDSTNDTQGGEQHNCFAWLTNWGSREGRSNRKATLAGRPVAFRTLALDFPPLVPT